MGGDYPALLTWGAGAPHATRNWDIAFTIASPISLCSHAYSWPLNQSYRWQRARMGLSQFQGLRPFLSHWLG